MTVCVIQGTLDCEPCFALERTVLPNWRKHSSTWADLGISDDTDYLASVDIDAGGGRRRMSIGRMLSIDCESSLLFFLKIKHRKPTVGRGPQRNN